MGTDDPAAELATSAKGWQGIQMAVIGFIGICGVLRDGGSAPPWLQWLTAALAGLSLVLAGMAIYLIGRVAYPFYGGGTVAPGVLAAAAGRLRRGIRTTFLAAAAIAIAAVSGWWPGGTEPAPAAEPAPTTAAAASVEVRDGAGRRFCGQLVEAPDGAVRVSTDQGRMTVWFGDIVSITPVEGC